MASQLYTLEADEDVWFDMIDVYEDEKFESHEDGMCEEDYEALMDEVDDLIDRTGSRFRMVIEQENEDDTDVVSRLICTYSIYKRSYRIRAWISLDDSIAPFSVLIQSFIRDADTKGYSVLIEISDAKLEAHRIMRKHKFECESIPVEHYIGEDGKYSNHVYRFKYFPSNYLAKKESRKKAKDG